MARNVEIKARVADLGGLRARAVALGATGPHELVQVDTFFVVAVGRLKLRAFGDGTGELIFYTRPDAAGPKVSTYQRVPAPDPAKMRDLLAAALGVRATVRKRRELFLFGQTRIHLDDVDGLGSFMELEVVLRDDQSVADGETVAERLMDALAVPSSDLVAGAYVDLR